MLEINLGVEGKVDEYIMLEVFKYLDLPKPTIRPNRTINPHLGGKSVLLSHLDKWNEASKWSKWVVMLDLDNDSDCPVSYIEQVLPNKQPTMYLRIVVREIEAWLMADSENLAKFIGVKQSLIPKEPESIIDPKQRLLEIVKKGKKALLDMIPTPESGRKIGIGYVSRIQEFLTHPTHPWRPEIAQQSAESLMRCIRALSIIPKT